MKNSIVALIIICLTLATGMAEAKGRKPCGGKKGGVAHCTVDGKFMCNDGSVSKSKKKCK